jgi:hypothetical protein
MLVSFVKVHLNEQIADSCQTRIVPFYHPFAKVSRTLYKRSLCLWAFTDAFDILRE